MATNDEIMAELKALRRDVAALKRLLSREKAPRRLAGARLRQVQRVGVLLRDKPDWTLHRACVEALRRIPGGYASAASLQRYVSENSKSNTQEKE